MKYDVLVQSLGRTDGQGIVTRWVRNISANSLSEACRIAEARHPNLGLTPTTASMAWPLYPQPKEQA